MAPRRSRRDRGPPKTYTDELVLDDELAEALGETRVKEEAPTIALDDGNLGETAMPDVPAARDRDYDDAYEAPEAAADEPESEPSDLELDDDEEVADTTIKSTTNARKSKVRQPAQANGKEGYMQISTMRGPQHSVLGYIASYDRSTKGRPLLRVWYGPDPGDIEIARIMLERWYVYPVLPPRFSNRGRADKDAIARVWRPSSRAKEIESARQWYERMHKESSERTELRALPNHEVDQYAPDTGAMPVLLGPASDQKEVPFSNGRAMSLTRAMLPFEDLDEADKSDEKSQASGWLFDVGGLPLDLSWASADDVGAQQLLAISVIPHADQEMYNYEKASQKPDFQKFGTVQIWSFSGAVTEENEPVLPSFKEAVRLKTICLDYGRARRLAWSPRQEILAILCGDGSVCIVEPGSDASRENEWVQQATTRLTLEEGDIKATCLSWCNTNRLVVGYTDGSLALWSIFPNRLLSRHPIHHNPVVEVSSAYPTFPYLVSSSSIGGPVKLVDLRAPSYDTTESTSSSINTQPHTISWSDHLLGFFCLLPSRKVFGTVVGFAHHEFYPAFRRISSPESACTALSAGKEHPYLLMGNMDGSVWAINPQVVLFAGRRHDPDRIRVLQHEHRGRKLFEEGSLAAYRGAARLLEGAKKEKNVNMRFDPKAVKAAKSKAKKDTPGPAQPTSYDGPAVFHEPLTRVTAMQWNPNDGYGCWAAISFGSGLIRVIDLGLKA